MADFLELLDALRATRDADSCQKGLNLFRKGLRGEGGPAFLSRYLRQSPDCQELQAIWDAQLTVQHYQVTVTLLLALADALTVAAAAAANGSLDAEQRSSLAAGGARLASAMVPRRLKALYFNLSSDVRGKANAALALLAALAGALAAAGAAAAGSGAAGGGTSLRDFVRAFDWSLSALPGLARPLREKKGESSADASRRYHQLWALGDPLKRPSRALFGQLALCLLRHAGGDAMLAQQLLRTRPLVGGLLGSLAADPPGHQLEVLRVLQRRVLSPKAGVPAAVQAEAFSDAALQQLAAIAASAEVEGEEEEEEKGEEEGGDAKAEGEKGSSGGSQGSAEHKERKEEQQAAAAALGILEALATDPSHGLAAAVGADAGAAGPGFVLSEAGSHQLQPGQRRLLRLLLRLRPADSAAHLRVLLAAAGRDAALAAAFLLALPYSLEPGAAGSAAAAGGSGAAGRWCAHAAVASRLLQLLPAAAPAGLLLAAQRGGPAPPPGGRQAQGLLRCCFPPCLQRAALSRGVQHPNSLVRYGTLGLLLSAMSALEAVLQDCAAAAELAASSAASSESGASAADASEQQQQREAARGWLALRGWLQHAARQHLPDPTLLLALVSAAEKEGWETANELQLAVALRLLLLWQRLLPATLAESNVDPERLLPQQPLAVKPQHQLLLLELLQAAADAAAEAAAETSDHDGSPMGPAPPAAAAASSSASLLPPLRLLVGASAEAVRAAARRWLLQRLLGSAVFAENEEEAVLWLDLLPRGSEAAATFLAEAQQLLLRRPHEFYELQQQLLSSTTAANGTAGSQPPPASSLLAPCALRQALRVLGPGKMAGGDKAAVAAYVAAVLRQLAEQQAEAGGTAALAAVLLGVVRQEAARQQEQQLPKQKQQQEGCGDGGGKKQKKRKSSGAMGEAEQADAAAGGPLLLPAEGGPLLALLAALEQQQGLGAGGQQQQQNGVPSGEEQPSKKAKKSKQRSSPAGTLPACGCAALDPAAGPEQLLEAATVGDACCLLVSELVQAGGRPAELAERLAAIQQRLAASEAEPASQGSSSSSCGVGTCSAALRQCLHWLGRPEGAAAAPALLQVLRAAVLAGDCSAAERRRCLGLLAGSSLVLRCLAGGDPSPLEGAVCEAVSQAVRQVLEDGDSAAVSLRASCLPLLEQLAAGFQRLVAAAATAGSQQEAGSVARSFLLLLPQMPEAALEAAADAVLSLDGLPGSSDSRSGGSGSNKKRRRKGGEDGAVEAAEEAASGSGGSSWLAGAAAAVLQELLARGPIASQGLLEQLCSQLLQLASVGEPAAFGCLLRLLSGAQRASAPAALGRDARQRLLHCCLQEAGSGASLAARAELAALLAKECASCRQAAPQLLLPLLGPASASRSAADLALALPTASALLDSRRREGREEEVEEGEAGQAAASVAAPACQALLAYFKRAAGGSADDEAAGTGKAKRAKKQAASGAADAAAATRDGAGWEQAQQLLRQHALPCLRLALQTQPLAATERQQLLAALLTSQGWQLPRQAEGAVKAAEPSSGPGAAEVAEAVVLVLLGPPGSEQGGASGSAAPPTAGVQELAAAVQCFAATLAGLLRMPPGASPLEPRLLALLDGPVGNAVAALPAAARSSPAFADLAATVAGTLGTAVLRHRMALPLAAAAGTGSEGADAAAAGAAAAGAAGTACVSAVRVLRRFAAALLPDEEAEEEEEEEEEEGSGSSSSSDGDGSSGSDSEDEQHRQWSQQRRAPQQELRSPKVAAAALMLLQRLLGHSCFLPAMRAAAASPPPLPPAAAALPRPLASLLPLAGAAGEDAPSAAAAETAADPAAEMKKELCELVETLLDLQERYSPPAGSSGGGSASEAAQQAQQAATAEAALLPLLMAGYGASCSPADAALWSLAASINARLWRRQQEQGRRQRGRAAVMAGEGEEDDEARALEALLHGPLSRSCFAWGPAAAALQALPPPPNGSEAGSAASDEAQQAQQAQQRQVLQLRLPLDPARAALTVCHWPEACSLAAPGSSGQQAGSGLPSTGLGGSSVSSFLSGSLSGSGEAEPPQVPPGCAAAYDPGFMLPFCCCALRQGLLAPRAFAEAGLLSVCLRGLASADAGCRAAAYQAVALFEAQLTAANAQDFKERQQLSVLLGALRAAVIRPFQRLPTVHAAFLAEAALLALHLGAAMYPAVHRHLSRRAVLPLDDVPLLGQLLLAGGQQHLEERRWMLQLLLAGLRSPEDAALYRRKHVLEQAMALADSCVADPAAASLALRLLCSATYIPRAARQLSQECGLIPWLASAAERAIRQAAQRGGAAAGAAGPDAAACAALAALRRLLHLRTVMRGGGAAAAAQHMAAAAAEVGAAAGAALGCARSGGPGIAPAAAPAAWCSQALAFLWEVQLQLDGGGQESAGKQRAPAGCSGLLTVAAAAAAALEAAVGGSVA